jgi:glycosyltransferase involved in cell wall biosynthesis
MPHRRFVLLGRNWPAYEKFDRLLALPNFSYLEAPNSEHPNFYSQIDVFVSPARLEGGPIALIEAMMSKASRLARAQRWFRDRLQRRFAA